MKVIVTGATGFLGHWLVKRLTEEGHEVHALVRPKSDVSELKGLEFKSVFGDVTDKESLLSAFQEIDTVFHLAGVIAYKPSDRPLMEKVNIHGTANVLAAIQACRVRKLVHLSSVVAVGAGFTPNDILNEKSVYNVSHLNLGYFETKRAAEQLVLHAFQKNQIDPVILNPSTIYGAGDAKKGSRKTQIKVARGEFKFYTPGGVNVVDVEDVVEGILKAWKVGRSGERYILSGENMTIKDLFQKIADAAGVQAPKTELPRSVLRIIGALGDLGQSFGLKTPISSENAWTSTLYHWFDSSKARTELGFQSRPAQEAIQKSVLWMKENSYLDATQ